MIITETFKNDDKDISALLQEYVCLIFKYKDENNEINDTNNDKRVIMETANKMLCKRKENNV
ncbi:MAG: hypothetical protein MR266_03170 [Erysipelotrichaceae bacterium]|nr:hypothetical protein [Erysipelotrichaceae bacterium]